jgi:heavy metal translocating P-type ATPase
VIFLQSSTPKFLKLVMKSCCNEQGEAPIEINKIPENKSSNMLCSKENCCSDESRSKENASPPVEPSRSNHCSERGCCSSASESKGDSGEERKKHSWSSGHDQGQETKVQHQIKARFSDKKRGIGIRLLPTKLHHHLTNPTKTDCCSPKEVFSRHSSKTKHSESFASQSTHVNEGRNCDVEPVQVDVEDGLYGVEHILIQVQGMDCTTCEKKLHRYITSLAGVSNVKTSLLLAQAEFDLVSSDSIDSSNIIKRIGKKTGYACTKILQSGAELELVMNRDLAPDWPFGVKDLKSNQKNHFTLIYHPKVIGARDLLSDPFFHGVKLAPPARPLAVTTARTHLRNMAWTTMISILLTVPVLVLTWAKLPKHEVLYGAISLGLATSVQTIIGRLFYVKAFRALIFSRLLDMDLLIVLSSSAAYIYSVVAYAFLASGKPLSTGEFFETSTLLITLIMIGKLVTAFALQSAVESITIESLQTPTAILSDSETAVDLEIDARLLQYGDCFKVLPDMRIVTDGVVVSGESEVDESMITGESTLLAKSTGMPVVAGSINHSGSLVIRVNRLPYENTIKMIGTMVDEAKVSTPKVQELADQVASYFIPVILGVTVLVFLVWIVVGIKVRHQRSNVACVNAMIFAISVLIVSCPCAIGLAVPMVVVIVGGVAARHGLVFKTAETIDVARKVSHVVFDKTGTLTQGNLHVESEGYPSGQPDIWVSMILGLTANSKHPVSKAINTHIKDRGVQTANVENIVSVAGSGIEASWNGSSIKAGNPYWLGIQESPEVQRLLDGGCTMFCVTANSELVAVFALKDCLRPDALETIAELQRRSIEVSIISGDNEAAVHSIATQLSIPTTHVRARCSPQQKQAYVKSLLNPEDSHDHANCDGNHSKHSYSPPHHANRPVVLFAGDGTNDAPSLAQASIGIHINDGGTDVAASAADAVLMRPSLSGILTLIDLSQAFHRRVLFNFIWSGLYNTFAVLIAAGVFVGARGSFRIPPMYAGLGEVVSVVPVVAVAMALKWWRP